MDKEKCEECPKKDNCDLYDLISYIDENNIDVETIIIPYLDTEHSISEKYQPQPALKNPKSGDSKLKEYNSMNDIVDFLKLYTEKKPSGKINVLELPMLSLEKNPNHMPLKGRKFPPTDYRIAKAVQFWKDILIEETEDRDMIELSIECLQYLLPDSNIVEDIKRSEILKEVCEKCVKMEIKEF